MAVAADASNRTLRAPLRLHQEDFTQGHTMAPYIADEMEEDIEPRRLILENI